MASFDNRTMNDPFDLKKKTDKEIVDLLQEFLKECGDGPISQQVDAMVSELEIRQSVRLRAREFIAIYQ